jgi:DNA-binding CsgD family transcriptional regulator
VSVGQFGLTLQHRPDPAALQGEGEPDLLRFGQAPTAAARPPPRSTCPGRRLDERVRPRQPDEDSRGPVVTDDLIAAALQVRAARPEDSRPGGGLAEPLTAAEPRILKLLPTSSYQQIADTLYISRNTVKVHLRSVYQKLEAASRAQAIERAIDLHLL